MAKDLCSVLFKKRIFGQIGNRSFTKEESGVEKACETRRGGPYVCSQLITIVFVEQPLASHMYDNNSNGKESQMHDIFNIIWGYLFTL